MEKFVYLIINLSMWVITVWAIIPIIIDDITIDSIIARLSLISACIANLFQKKKKINISLFIVSIILIITATIIKIY
ncbi:hypothetical protein, membrane [gut metagenome]|uniref:Uncharacterized protein n=1 Tax=gut metagenome TaxID=749906 RepID=J9G452_9ZZZZ